MPLSGHGGTMRTKPERDIPLSGESAPGEAVFPDIREERGGGGGEFR